MVNRFRSLTVVLVAIGTLALGQQAAYASFDPGGSPPPSDGSSGSTSGSSSGSGSGSAAHNTSGTCSLYATASSFGLACLTGGGDGAAKTIAEILGKGYQNLLPICWDEPISEADWQQNYNADGSPYPSDMPAYNETCLNGLEPDKPVTEQDGLQITQLTVQIPDGRPCGDPPLAGAAAVAAAAHQCVQTLTGAEKQVVGGFDSQLNGDIPRPSITTFPAPGEVRSQVPTAFVDTGEPARNSAGYIQTPDVQAGGTVMFARMDPSTFKIDPGDGTGTFTCADPFANVDAGATPANTPQSCWHTYARNSYDQPNRAYHFTAQVQWTVYANGRPLTDRGDGHTATFTEVDTVDLEVDDVQTLVIGNR